MDSKAQRWLEDLECKVSVTPCTICCDSIIYYGIYLVSQFIYELYSYYEQIKCATFSGLT